MKNSKRKKQAEFSNIDSYFDDCILCRMMKEAEEKGKVLTESELKLGFKKMKEKGAIVGGKWVKDQKEDSN